MTQINRTQTDMWACSRQFINEKTGNVSDWWKTMHDAPFLSNSDYSDMITLLDGWDNAFGDGTSANSTLYGRDENNTSFQVTNDSLSGISKRPTKPTR